MVLKMFSVHPLKLVLFYAIASFVTAFMILLGNPFWLFSNAYIALTVHVPILALCGGMIYTQVKGRNHGWLSVVVACFACIAIGLLQVCFALFIAAGV